MSNFDVFAMATCNVEVRRSSPHPSTAIPPASRRLRRKAKDAALRARQETENRFMVLRSLIDGIFSTANSLIRWGTVAYLGNKMYLAVTVLAGKTTLADIGVNFLADVRVSEGLLTALGVSATGYGISQRKLRRKTVERLQGRIIELEGKIDKERTSSRLTPTGETNPEDGE
jgi:hypothetical protein